MPTLHRDFLIQTAAETGLAPKQAEVFLQRFAEDLDYSTIQRNLGISEDACSQLMSQVYKRFSIQGRTRGKESQLLSLLLGKSQESNVRELNPSATSLDWHQISRRMLNAQGQRFLTTNPLTAGDGMRLELERMYVPTTVVERKQRSRYISNVSLEREPNLRSLEPQCEAQSYHGDNFERAIKKRETPKSEGQRIALIGLPGIGKTTRLQRIAVWVLENLKQDVVIWVSLSDLQGKTLEQYLLEDWLKNALAVVRVKPEMEELLAEQFRQNRVWLLLDGLDEMQPGLVNPLTKVISNQLTGWLASARILLTCRLNAWDVEKNYLDNTFDVYLCSGFNSELARNFLDKMEIEKELKLKLQNAFKRNVEVNPLELVLSQNISQQWQSSSIQNDYFLRKQFINKFYEWKQEYFPVSFEQRQKLNKQLKFIALKTLCRQHNYFVLKTEKDNISLLELALNLGLLNIVGTSEESSDGKIYNFINDNFLHYLASEDAPLEEEEKKEVMEESGRASFMLLNSKNNLDDHEDFIKLKEVKSFRANIAATLIDSTVISDYNKLCSHLASSYLEHPGQEKDDEIDSITTITDLLKIYNTYSDQPDKLWMLNEIKRKFWEINNSKIGHQKIKEFLSRDQNKLDREHIIQLIAEFLSTTQDQSNREFLTTLIQNNEADKENFRKALEKIIQSLDKSIENNEYRSEEKTLGNNSLIQLIELIELDREGIFSSQHIQGHPEVNFKYLFKRKVVDNEEWTTINQSLEDINDGEIQDFYNECINKILPQVKRILQK